MKVTTVGRYGLQAVLNIASAAQGKRVIARDIAEEEHISIEFLQQILSRLRQKHIVKSRRGPKGGYTIGRDPADITVLSILDAVGEDSSLLPREAGGKANDPVAGKNAKIMADFWADTAIELKKNFNEISVKDLFTKYLP